MKSFATCMASIGLCGLAACGGNAGIAPAATTTPPVLTVPLPAAGIPSGYRLVWSDEFNTDGLPDASKWNYDTSRNKLGWYNNELQYYSRDRAENASVTGGKLVISALKEKLTSAADYGGQSYTSSRMLTQGIAEWTYGYFEIRAKLACGVGTWPAIWMLGKSGAWPAMGEIDIMEHVGRKKGEVLGTIHTSAYNHTVKTQKGETINVPDACDTFHTYKLNWNSDQIAIGVDDKYYFQFVNPKDGDPAKWPFNGPQYLILNVAIGGDLGGAVDDSIFPTRMEIDYVRVYQR